MRKIVASLHVTLDGFVAGPNGEMDWIKLDEELFDLVGEFTREADTALYGRITYQMMDSYWPTAADQPHASKHDVEHSTWYNKVHKVVLSKTMAGESIANITFVSENVAEEIGKLKNKEGNNIMIFGSASAVHHLMENGLIDDYWLFINPIILGEGLSLFTNTSGKISLKLNSSKVFSCGVVALHYSVENE